MTVPAQSPVSGQSPVPAQDPAPVASRAAAARSSAGPILNLEPLPGRLPCQQLAAELMQAALSIPTAATLSSTRELAAMLHACEPCALPHAERLAFWINVYNALVQYFAAHAELDQDAYQLRLPRLMKYFRGDFGGREAARRFAARYLKAEPGRWLLANAGRLELGYTDYDWTIESHHYHAAS